MKTYQKTESIPVVSEVDLVVAGGGPAGISAALAAGRLGLKTVIIEQFNCLGGIATAGGHNHICLYSSWGTADRVVGGVIYELAKRTADAGYGICTNSSADYELEGMKLVLEQMAEQANVDILYYTQVCDVLVEDGAVTGVVVQSKTGRQVILAKRVIDCTGDGDVAARAGCGFDMGDEDNGLCQPMTLMFTIGGVDYEQVKNFRKDDYKLSHVWKKAQDDGFMRPFQSVIMGWWWTPTRPDQLGINFTHINYVDGTSAKDLTKATIEGRKQAYETVDVYRRYVPGMENCYMISTPNTIGVRETRRIHGGYTLTKEDVLGQRQFDDSIGYGSFFIDIHSVSGPGMDKKAVRPDKGFRYQIPYRIIVPHAMGNLWVAGRCASATHEALGSLRVMPQCGVMGEAAGTAAYLSIRDTAAPGDIDIKELQMLLRKNGGIIGEDDIIRG